MANENVYIDIDALSTIKDRIISEINNDSSLANFNAGACGDNLLSKHLKQTKDPTNIPINSDRTKVEISLAYYDDKDVINAVPSDTIDITTMTIGNTEDDIVGPIPPKDIK